jgi:ABC-2 type transport system ATP-binding protein
MNSTAMSLRGLTKRYGHRTVVDGLDLDLPAGVTAGFVGPNGAGKTTTMAMALGLVRPTAGGGTVLGAPIARPAAYLPRVGALIENPAFYPALSGARNLAMLATVAGQDPAQIPSLLTRVGLGERGGDRYRDYSLGMKQRLGIAAALLGDPDLLILDEPARGLDPAGVREMRSLIARLGGGRRTVLVSSHDLNELEQVCDWLVLIDDGRSVFQGPTDELLHGSSGGLTIAAQHPAQHVALVELLVRAGHRVDRTGGQLVVHPAGDDPASLAVDVNRAAFDAGIVLSELSPRRLSLEDRYLDLVHGGAR